MVFVAAAWHSGSTLLGVMLGAHPSILYAGEAMCVSRLDDTATPGHQRSCRLCGPPCPVWAGLARESGPDLWDELSRRSRRPLIFDSSKSRTWVTQQAVALAGSVPASLVVLVRDGRGVVNSHRRKHPDVAVSAHAEAWVEKMKKVEALARDWSGPTYRIRYEDLVSYPSESLRSLSVFLGVPFDRNMLDPWSGEIHPLDSNPGPLLMMLGRQERAFLPEILEPSPDTVGFYVQSAPRVSLDLRWQTEMNAEELLIFDRIAGRFNAAYTWG